MKSYEDYEEYLKKYFVLRRGLRFSIVFQAGYQNKLEHTIKALGDFIITLNR